MPDRNLNVVLLVLLVIQLHAKPIDQSEAVMVGGIRQWISIQGAHDTLPVLLYLHGGPGNSVMRYADRFTMKLQKHFVVVHWDQRESGKTAELNTSRIPLSVELMEQDAVELVNYLRHRFNSEKIYLVGHSWGGFLALRVASMHPEWLVGCVAVAPMVNQWESEKQTLTWLLERARSSNNQEAIGELSTVHVPFRSVDELFYVRRWLRVSNGGEPLSQSEVRKWGKKWFQLYTQACSINLFEEMPGLACPVYFLLGRLDRQASSSISEAYYRELKAEKKELIWFTKSAHSLNLTEPIKFQEAIIGLLPKKAGE